MDNGKQHSTEEEVNDEELQELVLIAQQEALEEAKNKELEEKPKRKRMPALIIWIMSIVLLLNTFAFVFEVFSIPAVEFIKTSAKLSANEEIADYKKTVVVIETGSSRGTGFSISSDGIILTNHHVVEGQDKVTVSFPNNDEYVGTVIKTYPDIDLAAIEINGEDLPYLPLADEPAISDEEQVVFIGNPLRFTNIANEGTVIGNLLLDNWKEPVTMIQASVYRGNSGSPVINETGEVIGIIFATLEHENYGRVGLFVPVESYQKRR